MQQPTEIKRSSVEEHRDSGLKEMKEVIRNMERMTDYYFRRKENTVTLSEDRLDNNRFILLEGKRSSEENESPKIPEEKESKREHLTATYWG
jgi:hypothetical protein